MASVEWQIEFAGFSLPNAFEKPQIRQPKSDQERLKSNNLSQLISFILIYTGNSNNLIETRNFLAKLVAIISQSCLLEICFGRISPVRPLSVFQRIPGRETLIPFWSPSKKPHASRRLRLSLSIALLSTCPILDNYDFCGLRLEVKPFNYRSKGQPIKWQRRLQELERSWARLKCSFKLST